MNNQKITILKFQACTGIEESVLREWSTSKKYNHNEFASKFQNFNEILIENDMQEFANLLWNYFNQYLISKDVVQKNNLNYETFKNIIQDDNKIFEELTNLLHFLFSNRNKSINSIKIRKQRVKITINNKKNIESVFSDSKILESSISEFEKRKYNEEALTINEAKEEIRKNTDSKWISKWIMQHEYNDLEGFRIYDDIDFEIHTDYFNPSTGKQLSGEVIINQMIQDYAESHVMEREVTSQFIEKLIDERFSSNKKSGPPEKNKDLKIIVRSLSYLKRIDRYLNNEKVTDIEQIKLESDDCKFAFDCIDFFNLNDKENKSPKPKYIRTLLGQIKIPYNPGFFKKIRIAKFVALKSQISSIHSTKD